MRGMSRKAVLFLAAGLALSGCASHPRPAAANDIDTAATAETEAVRRCRANLKEMQKIKTQWAADEHKTGSDAITREDLMRIDRYILNRFECPAGGNYTWGRVGERATCSVPGHVLK